MHDERVARDVTLVCEWSRLRDLTESPGQVIDHDMDAGAHLALMRGSRGREAHGRAPSGSHGRRHRATRHSRHSAGAGPRNSAVTQFDCWAKLKIWVLEIQ